MTYGEYNRGSESSLKSFTEKLNKSHDTIKFTATYSKTEDQFFDVITYKKNDRIYTKLYQKPTDSCSYLEFSSCHPYSIKKSIPYSQMLRIRRNCTEWIDFSKNIIKLCLHLSKQGYPNDIIKDSVKRVAKLGQSDALKSQLIDDSNCKFFCITEFNPSIPDIQSFIRNIWPLFDRNSSTRNPIRAQNNIWSSETKMHSRMVNKSRCESNFDKIHQIQMS